jgi:hypothetical protein
MTQISPPPQMTQMAQIELLMLPQITQITQIELLTLPVMTPITPLTHRPQMAQRSPMSRRRGDLQAVD